MNSNDIFVIEWQDPQTKTVLSVKYLKPWQWSDVVNALKEAEHYFKSIDHKAIIIHDQSKFPPEQSTIGAVKDLWGNLPLPPANLRACFVVNQSKNYMLEVAFDIVEKAFFRRTVTHFVYTMGEVEKMLEAFDLNSRNR